MSEPVEEGTYQNLNSGLVITNLEKLANCFSEYIPCALCPAQCPGNGIKNPNYCKARSMRVMIDAVDEYKAQMLRAPMAPLTSEGEVNEDMQLQE